MNKIFNNSIPFCVLVFALLFTSCDSDDDCPNTADLSTPGGIIVAQRCGLDPTPQLIEQNTNTIPYKNILIISTQ